MATTVVRCQRDRLPFTFFPGSSRLLLPSTSFRFACCSLHLGWHGRPQRTKVVSIHFQLSGLRQVDYAKQAPQSIGESLEPKVTKVAQVSGVEAAGSTKLVADVPCSSQAACKYVA